MYKNYIFDFYGTLVYIHTDEQKAELWQKMAALYSCYGADYTPAELQEAYQRICHEEEEKLQIRTGYTWPEINLEEVFLRLRREAPRTHKTAKRMTGLSEWTYAIASAFRCISRESFGIYENTMDTLTKLKEQGCGIYLLSNAQALFTRPEMETAGLSGMFDGIYLSSDHEVRKPDPVFMRKLLERYQLDPAECVMVGNDFEADIRTAMDAGMDSVFLNTYHYLPAEAERRFSEIRMNSSYRCRMILSGDIGELLQEETR